MIQGTIISGFAACKGIVELADPFKATMRTDAHRFLDSCECLDKDENSTELRITKQTIPQ